MKIRSFYEVDVMRHIQRLCPAQLIDEFEHTGPNGVHRCTISEVLGPALSSDIEDLYPDEEYPVVSQIARGLQYLHHLRGRSWRYAA